MRFTEFRGLFVSWRMLLPVVSVFVTLSIGLRRYSRCVASAVVVCHASAHATCFLLGIGGNGNSLTTNVGVAFMVYQPCHCPLPILAFLSCSFSFCRLGTWVLSCHVPWTDRCLVFFILLWPGVVCGRYGVDVALFPRPGYWPPSARICGT